MVKESAPQLARGISAQGRSRTYRRRGLWKLKEKHGGQFPKKDKKEKPASDSKPSKWYPADDVKKPLAKRVLRYPTRLRSTLTPGTVVILLAGRFKGKRVVFLKQLPSGLLLVTGPFKVNGVPARRVNQVYVIATSTKVDLPALNLDKYTDAYFKAVEPKKSKKGEDDFFSSQQEKKELSKEYIENQKELDTSLLGALNPDLKGYLSARFSLKSGDRPHLMKF